MKLKILISICLVMLSILLVTQTAVAADAQPIDPAISDRVSCPNSSSDRSTSSQATQSITYYTYLPLISRPAENVCAPTGETYGTLAPLTSYSGDASTQPDINLAVRGYTPTIALLDLVDYAGSIDPAAPQLYTLFDDQRTPIFNAAYQVYRWDWSCNCRGGPIAKWPVTLIGMQTTPGELIHSPIAGYDIGGGYGALVLYAEAQRITLHYTGDDSPVDGYTIHLENVCVDPNLLELYRQSNAAGRLELPALLPGQALGRALGNEIDAATRDQGSLLDPRSRKDWWQGR